MSAFVAESGAEVAGGLRWLSLAAGLTAEFWSPKSGALLPGSRLILRKARFQPWS